jgi:hypothetical protein
MALFTRPPHHATPPVVEVAFAQGKEVRPVDFTLTVSWKLMVIYSVMLPRVLLAKTQTSYLMKIMKISILLNRTLIRNRNSKQ